MATTIILVAGGLSQTAAFNNNRDSEREVIEGVVVEYPSGAPLPGCKVTISPQTIISGFGARQTYSAGQGYFRFADIASGPYLVSVEPPAGHIPSRLNPSNQVIQVKTGKSLPRLQFVFAEAPKISGVVVSEEGRPVAGASVYALVELYDPVTAITRVAIAGSTWTGTDGTYQVGGIAPGRYRVAVGPGQAFSAGNVNRQQSNPQELFSVTTYWPSAIEYESAQPIVVPPGQNISTGRITLRSAPARTVTVTWIGNSGKRERQPSQAKLVPLAASDVDLAILSQSAGTREDGTFRLENVAAGRYRIELSSGHNQVASQEVIVERGPGEDHYSLYESPAETLYGEISTGATLADLSAITFQLMLISRGGESTKTAGLKLDKNRRFQTDVCACLYRIFLPSGSGLFIAGMTLDGRETSDFTLDLRQSHASHLVIKLSAESSALAITTEQQSGAEDGQPFVVLFRLFESTAHPVFLESAAVLNGGVRLSGIRPGRYGALVASVQDLSLFADPSVMTALQNKMQAFELQPGSTKNLTLPILGTADLVESARQAGAELF